MISDHRSVQRLSQQLEEHSPQDLRPRVLRGVRGKADCSTVTKVSPLWQAIWKGGLHAHHAVKALVCTSLTSCINS